MTTSASFHLLRIACNGNTVMASLLTRLNTVLLNVAPTDNSEATRSENTNVDSLRCSQRHVRIMRRIQQVHDVRAIYLDVLHSISHALINGIDQSD